MIEDTDLLHAQSKVSDQCLYFPEFGIVDDTHDHVGDDFDLVAQAQVRFVLFDEFLYVPFLDEIERISQTEGIVVSFEVVDVVSVQTIGKAFVPIYGNPEMAFIGETIIRTKHEE